MAYQLFLFDADDTLFDFQASEKRSFGMAMQFLGVRQKVDEIYSTYRTHGAELWRQLEQGQISKDFLKTERFNLTFSAHGLDISPALASDAYLEILSETVVLVDHALEICEFLASRGEVGIITNGIDSVQRRRLKNSPLFPLISFMAVSEECGFAKPDVRFFEYTSKLAKKFSKQDTLVVGDRFEADIDGAHAYGVDACWFNPQKLQASGTVIPKFEIRHLSELKKIIEPDSAKSTPKI